MLEVQIGKVLGQLRGGALDFAGHCYIGSLGCFHHLEADHGLPVEIGEAAPFSGKFEWFALPLGIIAGVALIRYKVNVMTVIAAGGLAGLAYSL